MKNDKPVKESAVKPKGRDAIVQHPPKHVLKVGSLDSQRNVPAYDLKKIVVDGTESYARPVQWNGKDANGYGIDKLGKPVEAIAWVTTCPKCNQLLQFVLEDIVIDPNNKDISRISCKNCNKSIPKPAPELKKQPLNQPLPKFSADVDKLKEEMKAHNEVKKAEKLELARQALLPPPEPPKDTNINEQRDVVVNLPPEYTTKKTQEGPPKPTEAHKEPVKTIEYEPTRKSEAKDIPGFVDPIKSGVMIPVKPNV